MLDHCGASMSEHHTSELNTGFFIYIYTARVSEDFHGGLNGVLNVFPHLNRTA